jgi:cell division protein FtsW
MTTTRPPRRPTKPARGEEPNDGSDGAAGDDDSGASGQQLGEQGQTSASQRPAAIAVAQRMFGAETSTFFVLLGTTLFLVAFGLVMVLSSSAVESFSQNDGNFFSSFQRQGLYALIGVPLMLVASRMPLAFWKRWAWIAIVGAMVLQLLVFVPGIGWGFQGNQNWIKIAGFTAQPSELVKLGLVLWVAWIITAKGRLMNEWKHVLVPIGPVAGLAIGLVLLGADLGTALVMIFIVLGCLFYGGIRLRIIGVAILVGSLVAFVLTRSSVSRTQRIDAWLNGCTSQADQLKLCWQTVHGWWGIASGGVFGSGLGQSKVKWKWLPEADNDFIFAIIGDELGLIGAVLVLALFVVLTIAFIRIARSSVDPFAKVVTSGVMIWVVGQAFVNIAVVLGLLPVLGVPLPLISAGGSSLIVTLLGIGVVLSFARHAPVTS